MARPIKTAEKDIATNSRGGKKAIAGYYSEKTWLQFKALGVELGGKSMQQLLADALNLLFKKHGKDQIAE